MSFSVKLKSSSQPSTSVLVTTLSINDKKLQIGQCAQSLDQAADGQLNALIEGKRLAGKFKQVDLLHNIAGVEQLLVLGTGKKEELNHTKIKELIKVLLNKFHGHEITEFSLALDDLAADSPFSEAELSQLLMEALHGGLYRYRETQSKPKDPIELKTVELLLSKKADQAAIESSIKIGQALGAGQTLCKELSNLPGNVCTPTYLAKQARKLGKDYPINTSVLDEAKMKKLGMGSLLSVSRGSREPAKLIVMEYNGGGKKDKPIVLVGKGLTFDAGGISIKPSAAMDEMKYDMCGGASVFGVMRALGELGVPINVVGVVPASENLPDGDANKPGDIVTSMAGTTIEILNTDAEGRLILCDALTYVAKYKPEVVVDIATLTGAVTVALGQVATGLFSNDEELANQLLEAGERSGDRAWRLPVWDEYQPQLKSNFADVANIGGRFAGSVTAACFLKRFCEDYRWAHLDIAGTAWRGGSAKGATGRPVGLLLDFVLNYKG